MNTSKILANDKLIDASNPLTDTSSDTTEQTIIKCGKYGVPPCRVSEKVGSAMFIIGATPPGILAKHFNDIAKQSGYHSETALAIYLSKCSTQERNNILKTFYLEREPHIRQLSFFNQIYDCKQVLKLDENIPCTETGKRQQKKTIVPKPNENIPCTKTRKLQGKKTLVLKPDENIPCTQTRKLLEKKTLKRKQDRNKLIQRRRKYKDVNWDSIFQNNESSDEINEDATDEDEQGVSNKVETATLKPPSNCETTTAKNKISLGVNSVKSPVVFPVTSSDRRIIENDRNSTPSEVSSCSFSKDENSGNSVIDKLLFTSTTPNAKCKNSKEDKSESNLSRTKLSSENDCVKKRQRNIYDHSLDELLGTSSCSTKSKINSNCKLTHEDVDTCFRIVTGECESVVTIETARLSGNTSNLDDNKNNLSVLDELLATPSCYLSPRKLSKYENVNGESKETQSSIIDELLS